MERVQLITELFHALDIDRSLIRTFLAHDLVDTTTFLAMHALLRDGSEDISELLLLRVEDDDDDDDATDDGGDDDEGHEAGGGKRDERADTMTIRTLLPKTGARNRFKRYLGDLAKWAKRCKSRFVRERLATFTPNETQTNTHTHTHTHTL